MRIGKVVAISAVYWLRRNHLVFSLSLTNLGVGIMKTKIALTRSVKGLEPTVVKFSAK